MHRIITLACLLLLASVQLVRSQSTEVDGYVQQLDSTIERGKIELSSAADRSLQVRFKSNITGTYRSYSPAALLGYGYENRKFEPRFVYLNNEEPVHVFAEVLVKGRGTLLLALFNLFLEKDGAIRLLQPPDNERQQKPYLEVINTMMNDCPNINRQAISMEFNTPSLIKLTKDYNTCVSPRPAYLINYEVWAGYSPGNLNLTSSASTMGDITAAGFHNQQPLVMGVQVVVTPFPKWSAVVGAMYNKFQVNFAHQGAGRYSVMDLSGTQLTIPISVRRNLTGNRWINHVQAGAYFSLMQQGSASFRVETENSGSVYSESSGGKFTDPAIGVSAGAGRYFPVHRRLRAFVTLQILADVSPAAITEVFGTVTTLRSMSIMFNTGFSF